MKERTIIRLDNPFLRDYRISAVIVGALAVHPALGQAGTTITHVATGIAVMTMDRDETTLIPYAQMLNAIDGWDRSASEIGSSNIIIAAVQAIYEKEVPDA